MTECSQSPCSNVPGIPIKPPRVFYAALLSGGLLQYFAPLLFVTGKAKWALLAGGGALLFLAGLLLMLLAARTFRRADTPVCTDAPVRQLVGDGVYRWTRNPMYVGFLLCGIGSAGIGNSVWVLGMLNPFFGYLCLLVVPREEAYLAARFGAEYHAYRCKTRRWL